MPAGSGDAPAIADLLAFWREAGPARWFGKAGDFDRHFRERFLARHLEAAARRLDHWADFPDGAVALLVLLDQFPRNAFRGTAHMYATDPLARLFTRRLVAAGLDRQVDADLRPFIYLPLMHSEDLADQEASVALYEAMGGPSLPFALEHRDIIRRFGRFPHRNALLGRETTPEEQAFLDGGGFAG
jgi:uncharacterized protein (DUF924 family)